MDQTIPHASGIFMYEDLKALFGGEVPSVRKFTRKLSELTASMQAFYYKAAYNTAFTEWDSVNKSYRAFLSNLLLHDKQQTVDYLRKHTVLGTFVYVLREPEVLRRLMATLEGKRNDYMPSYYHLAFCLLLVFDYPETIDYMSDKLRMQLSTTDDLCYLIDLILLNNEPGHTR